MNNPFDAPPEGAIPTGQNRANSVKYKNTKGIGKDFSSDITPQWISEKFAAGQYGFSMYNSDDKTSTAMPDFTFVILAVYSGISGYNPDKKERFWSNRAKDTRDEPLFVKSNLVDGPILSGIYSKDIKDFLPKGAKYTKFIKAYCLQTESVVEITLSAMVEAAIQKAIASTDATEKKQKEWDRVFLLSIADNDHLWGLHLKGHTTTDIKGNAYSGEGDLFFSPVFQAGVVNPAKSPDLHAKCAQLQNEERALHESYKQRNADKGPTETSAPAPGGRVENWSEGPAMTTTTNPAIAAGFPDDEPGDDLPF